jgi:uncharacterized protein
MRLNLREIINIPNGYVPFDYEPDLTGDAYGSVVQIKPNARAVGGIRNIAGVLTFTADIDADMVCVCARCLKEFDRHVHLHTEAVITEEDESQEDSDAYFLDGDYADVDEIINTAFVLNMEQRFLCKEDCKGLCDKCGADLNDGPCSCKAEIDPRLAVLGQLLEND